MRFISVDKLIEELKIKEKLSELESSKVSHIRFVLDDYLIDEVKPLIQGFNRRFPQYHFEHQIIYSGFGHDLKVTRKKQEIRSEL